jgi:hypothetical protein
MQSYKIVVLCVITLSCLCWASCQKAGEPNQVGMSKTAGQSNTLPMDGSEVSLTQVFANPKLYAGKEIVVVGGIKVHLPKGSRAIDSRENEEQNAGDYTLFDFLELRKDSTSTGVQIVLWVPVGQATPLVNAILRTQDDPKAEYKYVRAHIRIAEMPFVQQNGRQCTVLLNWNFLNDAGRWE